MGRLCAVGGDLLNGLGEQGVEGSRSVRMRGVGYPGTLLAKTLIIHYEPSARLSVILVPETLGF